MALLLQQALAHGVAPGYARRLLYTFEAGEPGTAEESLAHPPTPTLVEPLTDRELEVLRLLRTDLTGPEMAAALVVSVNTIKTHIKHIYSKLNVHCRYEAVQRAAEIGLL
jgi:LuxR family maltose regulon positive regulatory protein